MQYMKQLNLDFIFKRKLPSASFQIIVDDINIDVVRKDIKNINITVKPPEGRTRIAAPLRHSDDFVKNFALKHLDWIKKHRQDFLSRDYVAPKKYATGETHYLRGKGYLLKVVRNCDGKPEALVRDSEYIDLFVKGRSTFNNREKLLREFYREELKKTIPDLIKKWEKVIGVNISSWGLKHMKTRWGSCNIRAKRIWLSLELAKKSTQCLEYIIVHELVHLLERRHNKRFKGYMDKFMPNWRDYDKELKNRAF